jgi:hypothetical protein
MSDHPEWTRTVQDVHDATGIPRDGSGQLMIRDPLQANKFGAAWEKRGGRYYMSEETFREACRRLRRNG